MIDALLVVGHQPWAKGAANMNGPDSADDIYEFDFNLPLVGIVATGLILRGFDVETDLYARGGGNVARWNGRARLLVEFHCNAFNTRASGTEVLYGVGRRGSRKAANAVQIHLVNELGLPDRGTKPVKPGGRGAYLLHGIDGACIIPEPFFIDNDRDLARAQSANLAGAYTDGIAAALEIL